MGSDLFIRFIGIDMVSRVADRAGSAISRAAGKATTDVTAMGKSMISNGQAMLAFGSTMILVGAGIAAALGNSVMAAQDFNSELVMMVTHAGLASDKVQLVSNDLLTMAPQVGIVPLTLAEGFYRVQSAVTSLSPNLQNVGSEMDILRQGAELARIGHADLEATMKSLVGVMTSYKDSNLTAAQAASILNNTVGMGNMTMTDLNAALATGLAPIAAEAGIKLQSLGAAIATMTDLGIPASRAGTYIRSAILQIIQPSGPATAALESLGLAGQDVMERMGAWSQVLEAAGVNQSMVAAKLRETGSLSDTMQYLSDKMKAAGVSGQDATALLAKAFGGIRSGTGVVSLVNNLQGLSDKEKMLMADTNTMGQTWNYFTTHDPAFVWQKLQASFDALRITIGQALLPYALQLENWLIRVIPLVQSFVQQHADLIAKIAIGAAAFLLIGGIILSVAGLFEILSGSVLIVVGAVGAISAPVLLVVAAIALLVAWFALGSRGSSAIFTALTRLGVPFTQAQALSIAMAKSWQMLVAIWNTARGAIMGLVMELVHSLQTSDQMKGALASLAPAMGILAAAGKFLGVTLLALGIVIASLIGGVFRGLIGALQWIIPGAILLVTGAIEILGGVIQFVFDLASGHFNKLGQDAGTIGMGIIHMLEGVGDVLMGLLAFVANFVEGTIGAFQHLYDVLIGHSIIPDLINGTVTWFQSLPEKILNILSTMIADVGKAGIDLGTSLLNGIVNGLSNLGSAIGSAIAAAIPGGASGPLGAALKSLGIPGLASGGIVTDPTLALIGEGGPEAVVPLGSSASQYYVGPDGVMDRSDPNTSLDDDTQPDGSQPADPNTDTGASTGTTDSTDQILQNILDAIQNPPSGIDQAQLQSALYNILQSATANRGRGIRGGFALA